jgi:hypothetical protein
MRWGKSISINNAQKINRINSFVAGNLLGQGKKEGVVGASSCEEALEASNLRAVFMLLTGYP